MRYPILLDPVSKEFIWGGTKLLTKYGKDCGLRTLAECWELAVHPEGESGVANGIYAGLRLGELLQKEPGILGGSVQELPLLIKYIDTEQKLSVQVHPNDDYARQHHGEPGKTEFWYIMDCEPGAEIYYGLREAISKEEFIRRARDGSIEEVLNRVKVKPGDGFLIPPGLVHAIGEHMTVAEVGTNCNITYRIYDYGRVDAHGNPRALHVEDAAEVFLPQVPENDAKDGMIDCGPFGVRELRVHGLLDMHAMGRFQCILCVDGTCIVDRNLQMREGSSVLIPAECQYTLRGDATILLVTV